MRRGIVIVLLTVFASHVFADWQTHFAYTNVKQVAMGNECVYGLSDGALFSVNKQYENITIWTRKNGMSGTGVWMIDYDDVSNMLLAIYQTGTIDLIKGNKVTTLKDFYNKDMTASKQINNITFHKGHAFLSCEFGIVSFDMKRHEFVDTYYIGPDASEVFVEDIVIQGDSIYAFSKELLYRADMRENVMDYRNWKSEPLSDRIARDTNKRKKYVDTNGEIWTAGGSEGIVRQTISGTNLSYKPDGPLTNMPYRLKYDNGRIFMLSGGRWATQYYRPGHVMIYEDGKWTNIRQSYIQSTREKLTPTGGYAIDFMNVAVDPRDKDHFYVTAYGAGLYEFRGTELVAYHYQDNSTITTTVDEWPYSYMRCDGAVFDKDGNLLLLTTSYKGPVMPIRLPDGKWTGVNLYVNGTQLHIETPGEMLLDVNNPNLKFSPYCFKTPGLIVYDDNGTLTDESDDRCIHHTSFVDQDDNTIIPSAVYEIRQQADGTKWMGTLQGVIILPADVDYFTSNECRRLRIPIEDGWLLNNEQVNAFCFDGDGNVWCGTEKNGVYVLSADGNELLKHYTTENTLMPSDEVLSLAYDPRTNRVFIGTGLGLVSYSEQDTRISEEPAENNNDTLEDDADYGTMNGWTLHPAYANVTGITASVNDVYALSDGALFSLNKADEGLTYYNKLNGLSSTNIQFIDYNEQTKKLLIVYQNGMMDVLDNKGTQTLSDLFLKAESTEMSINAIVSDKQFAYFAMSFGIIVLDLQRLEIKDTYYIGEEASSLDVLDIAVCNDTLYAVTADHLYAGALTNNLIDYAQWKVLSVPQPIDSEVQNLTATNKKLYLLQQSQLYAYDSGSWTHVVNDTTIDWIRASGSHLLAGTPKGLAEIEEDGKVTYLTNEYKAADALWSNGEYWLAAGTGGVVRYANNSYQQFQPNGPLSNLSYRLQFEGDRLMIAQGGRWATQFDRPCDVMWYDYTAKQWGAIPADHTMWYLQHGVFDVMNYAIDPNNSNHFFATTYGTGLIEFLDGKAIKMYNEENSTLRSAKDDDVWQSLVRTDGALYDKHGNLWVENTGGRGAAISILTPQGVWYGLNLISGGQKLSLTTPGLIIQDRNYPNSKWLYDCREQTGVIVVDDGGTPLNPGDDHVLKRSQFIDQKGKIVAPNYIYCLTQDHSGAIWVGTNAGPFIIESVESFLESNACSRVIISRNDGTDLADYLLKDEQINAICVDGGNRKWIGTANSGLYLVSSDGLETIHHFTIYNSPLPSNEIVSLAIHPISGEVYIGTSGGLVSYRSDASEPSENFDGIYAYPNPVRPNFEGVITIQGLMDNTIVYIIDNGGNLVCKTRSNGGIATWDGKNQHGKRVSTGVYTVLCNTADGQNHSVTKILVTH